MEGMKTFSKNIIIDSSPKAALYALSEAGLLAQWTRNALVTIIILFRNG